MSEQMGFPLRQAGGGADEKREEDSNSSQVVCGHLVAHHVVPVTNFIWMKNRNTVTTNLKRHWHCYSVHGENRSRPWRQNSTHFSPIVSKKDSKFMRRIMLWEVPLTPTAINDPQIEIPVMMERLVLWTKRLQKVLLCFIDRRWIGLETRTPGGFVRIWDSSLTWIWDKRVDKMMIKTKECLITCLERG